MFYVSQMRRTVKKMAKCFPTSIVTGRCIDKVHFVRQFYFSFLLTKHDNEPFSNNYLLLMNIFVGL